MEAFKAELPLPNLFQYYFVVSETSLPHLSHAELIAKVKQCFRKELFDVSSIREKIIAIEIIRNDL